MTQTNIYANKRGQLVRLLSKTDLRRNHELYICSCYFDIASAKKLIKELVDNIKISRATVLIDRREAILTGSSELKKFVAEISKTVETNLRIVNHGPLFHTKAYAVSYAPDGHYKCGSLVIGSANLTRAGLIGSKGNIESLLDTQDPDYIAEFINSLASLTTIDVDSIAEFSTADSIAFKLALLNTGRFVYRWSGNLRQYMATRYLLNESGRKGLRSSETSEAVAPLGFNLDSASIGKSYFDFLYEPLENAVEEIGFIRNFGIETHLGHWVPKGILDIVISEGGDEYERFKHEIRSYWKREQSNITEAANHDYESLLRFGIIDPLEQDPGIAIRDRAEAMLENEIRLWRIYSKYAMSETPFEISQDGLIEEIHDEILETIGSRSNRNKSMKAYVESLERASLEPIHDLPLLNDLNSFK